MVYFIHDETSHTIKIGCAWNPQQRLSTLQISSSNKYVLLGSIAGTKRVEKRVHSLVWQHCRDKPGETHARSLQVNGEWFDDRILPFVTELIKSPTTFLGETPKKTPHRTRRTDKERSVHDGKLVLEFDSGETFRETFVLKADSPGRALAALSNIANARVKFLANTARITQLAVAGCPAREVALRGAFATQNCNPREGLGVNVHSVNGLLTMGVKQYVHRWLHGLPTELYVNHSRWNRYLTPEGRTLVSQFAQTLNQNGCVIVTKNDVLPVTGLASTGIGALPKGELRSKTNRTAVGKRRTQRSTGETQPKHGVVYFIEDTVKTDIKVGFCSKKPEKRLAALQTGNANLLRLIGHVAGSESHEKQLHEQFASFHIKGEWFSSTILAEVEQILQCAALAEWLQHRAFAVASVPPVLPGSAMSASS